MESDSDHDVVIFHYSSSDLSESDANNPEENNCVGRKRTHLILLLLAGAGGILSQELSYVRTAGQRTVYFVRCLDFVQPHASVLAMCSLIAFLS